MICPSLTHRVEYITLDVAVEHFGLITIVSTVTFQMNTILLYIEHGFTVAMVF